uniref:Uncharacterized protein n=1 Tax=Myotis myotis TaxID=51298 RepID=A0A7J7ZX97_MYOMY|nr:hypothetical protein mMyoMyo1_009663 [Myotis myotis]
MLPLGRRFPLPLAQAPLWLLSPASGNASGAREAPIRGPGPRARLLRRLGSGAQALGWLDPDRTSWFPGGVPLSSRGQSSPSPSLFTSLKVPGPPPPQPLTLTLTLAASEAWNPLQVPSYHDLVLDSSQGLSSLQRLKKFHFFRELFLRPPTPHGEPLPLSVPSSLTSGLPHFASRRQTSLANTHFHPRKVLPPQTPLPLSSPLSSPFAAAAASAFYTHFEDSGLRQCCFINLSIYTSK